MTKLKSRRLKKSTKRKPRAPPPTSSTLAPPNAGTSVVAPTSGSCSTCFYGRLNDTVRVCRVNRPTLAQGPPAQTGLGWPIVADNDWCGDGIDATSYGSFSPSSTQVPAAAIPVYMAPNPNPGATQTHLTGSAGGSSTLIRSGAGWITGITVNSMATGTATMTCYDGLDATGSVIAVIDVSRSNPSPQTAAPWGFNTGFFVVFSSGTGGADVTIISHSV